MLGQQQKSTPFDQKFRRRGLHPFLLTLRHCALALAASVAAYAAPAAYAGQGSSDGPANAASGCDATNVRTASRPFVHELRMPQSGGFLHSPATDAFLNSLADPLRAAYGFPSGEPHIYVVPTERVVTQALPENDIIVSVGVLEKTLEKGSGSELIQGYLAHEMGHLACKHPLHNQVWEVVDWAINAGFVATEFGGGNWTRGVVGNARAMAYVGGVESVAATGTAEWAYTHSGWSRDQETKADLIGAEMLIRAHQRTNGLVLALTNLPDLETQPGNQPAIISAFRGADHPGPDARRDAVIAYITSAHPGHHDPLPDEAGRDRWQAAMRFALPALSYILKAQQALGTPLALVGHEEYTRGYTQRTSAALYLVRHAFNAPRWQPDEVFPPQADPEMAALADLTLTKVVIAELRARTAPKAIEPRRLRDQIFALPDMPERMLLLNALGYAVGGESDEASRAVTYAVKAVGATRMSTLYGMAVTPTGAAQNGYTLGCMLTADTDFAQRCDDVQRNPKSFLDAQWSDARVLPPFPPLPPGALISTREWQPTAKAAAGDTPKLTRHVATPDEIRKTWLSGDE